MYRYTFKTGIVEQLKTNQAHPFSIVSFFPYKKKIKNLVLSIRKDCKGSRSILSRLKPKAAELYNLYHLLVLRNKLNALMYLKFV